MDAPSGPDAVTDRSTGRHAGRGADVARPHAAWWQTALDHYRSVLLAALVVLAYAALGVRLLSGDEPVVGLLCLLLALATVASLVVWLRGRPGSRPWGVLALAALVAAPFVWVLASR